MKVERAVSLGKRGIRWGEILKGLPIGIITVVVDGKLETEPVKSIKNSFVTFCNHFVT